MNKFVFTLILFLLLIEGCHSKDKIVQSGKKIVTDSVTDSVVTIPLIHGSSMAIPSDCAIYYPNDDSGSGMIYLKKNKHILVRFNFGYAVIDDSNSISLIRNLKVLEWDTTQTHIFRFMGMSNWRGDTDIFFNSYNLMDTVHFDKYKRYYSFSMWATNPKDINKIIGMYKSVHINPSVPFPVVQDALRNIPDSERTKEDVNIMR